MIPDLWKLETDDSDPSDKATLTEWGFASGRIEFVSQAPDVLSLTLSGAGDEDLPIAYGTDVTLHRDDVIVYRGRVTSPDRSFSGSSEVRSLRVENVWTRLLATEYVQTWQAWTGSAMTATESGRYRLGVAADGTYETTAQVLEAIQTFAASRGISFAWDLSSLPERRPGILEGQNRSIGQVIREVLAIHPDVVVRADYATSGTILRVVTRSSGGAVTLPLSGSRLSITPLHERQVDGLVIRYEGTVTRETIDASVEDLPNVAREEVLILPEDRWPADHVITERTLVQTLPAPNLSLVSARPPQIEWQRQPITTRPLPSAGATGLAAQKWWIEQTKLSTYGLTAADIALFPTSDAEHLAHTLTLQAEPEEDRPSAINPNAKPLYHPASVEDLPRELIDGTISDWMSVKVADVVAEATIAVSKTAVDALDAAKKAQFLRLGPRDGVISGVPAYLLDGQATVKGTNATTKVYKRPVSVNYDGAMTADEAAAANAAAYAAAVEEAVIPGLARELYEELSVLAYEGSLTLVANEAMTDRYLGDSLNIEAAARPEWATMRAQIQRESIDLDSGQTTLRFGPPDHLTVQDRVTLHEAARRAHDRRGQAASAPSNPATGLAGSGGSGEGSEADERASVQNIGPAITPKHNFTWQSGGTSSARRRWDLIPSTTEEGKYELYAPKIVGALSDVTAAISISVVEGPWTLSAGKWLVAEITDFSSFAVTVKLLETWTGYPAPYRFAGTFPYAPTAARIPLWRFFADNADGRVAVGGVYGEKLAPDGVARLIAVQEKVPGQERVRSVPDLA